MSDFTVPVIDMRGFLHGDAAARKKTAEAFGRAFETIGFATVINHGVDDALVRQTYESAKEFFHLEYAQKIQCTAPEKTKRRGYLPMGIESVAATLSGETPPDLCEALVFGSLQRERRGQGSPNYWPQQPDGLADCVNRYFDATLVLTRQLMHMSALALGLPEDYFAADFDEPGMTMRFVNYPDQVEQPRHGQLRYGAHHDYGGLTILRQDDAPGGLQICGQDGQWRDAPTHGQSFVINAGDLMSRWTNGRWKSTLHRVVNPPRELTGSTQRLSMVVFTSPNDNAEVRCLPSCQDAGHPPQYAPVQAGEYIRQKLVASMNIAGPAA